MSYKVSIIVPFYNAEKYLERSILSVFNQTHEDIELILVNNRSTDDSFNIASRFIHNNRFDVYLIEARDYQSHSYSVNLGIKRSTGDFIYTLDADDYIEPDYIEVLLNGFRLYPNALISVSNYTSENEFKKEYEVSKRFFDYKYLNSLEDIIKSYSKGYIPVMLWSKLYRKEVFRNFELNQSVYTSDVPNTYIILSQNPKIVLNSSRKYHYYNRKKSMSSLNNYNRLLLEQDISILTDKCIYFNELGSQYYEIIKDNLFNLFLIKIIYLKKISIADKRFQESDVFLNLQLNKLLHLKWDKTIWLLKNSDKLNFTFLTNIMYFLIIILFGKIIKGRELK